MSKTTRADGYSMTQTQKSVFLLPEDVDALFAVLQERFPDVRLMDNFMRGHIFLDWPRESDEPPPPEVVQSIPIPYLEKAAHTPHWNVLIWREPPNWSPVWGKPRKFSKNSKWTVLLSNPCPARVTVMMTRQVPEPHGSTYDIFTIYRTDDEEARQFVRETWKALRKIATNLVPYDGQIWGDMEARYRKEDLYKSSIWFGRYALSKAEELGVPAFTRLAPPPRPES